MVQPISSYSGNEAFAFLSYSHADAEALGKELLWLNDSGVRVWFDEGITPGSRWSEGIAAHVDGAALFIFFATKNSVQSSHCQDEINYALDQDKPVITVYLEDVELTPGLQLRLNSHQAIFSHQLEQADYRSKLLASVEAHFAGDPISLARNEFATRSTSKHYIQVTALALSSLALLLVGYYFFNSSLQVDTADNDSQPAVAVQTRIPDSIAVLPFFNVSQDPEQEYFSEGISEDILIGLTKIKGLSVIARGSSFRVRDPNLSISEIGDMLGAEHVLDGSVRRSGDQIRVTAQLIQVESGVALWSEQYNRELTGVFEVQDDITGEILQALNFQLEEQLEPRREINILAYNAYLLGQYQYSHFQREQAVESFELAIELDPTYAEAYVAIAESLSQYSLQTSNFDRQRIDFYIRRAKEINPELTSLQILEADKVFYEEHDYQKYIDQIYELLQAEPHNPKLLWAYADIVETLGKFDESASAYARLSETDPLDAAGVGFYAVSLIRAQRYEEASIELSKSESLGGFDRMGDYSAFLGTESDNVNEISKALALDNSNWDVTGFWKPLYRATIAIIQDNWDVARSEIEAYDLVEISREESFDKRRLIPLIRGDIDLAIEMTEEGLANQNKIAYWLVLGGSFSRKYFPEYFSDPRFINLLEQYNLDPESVDQLRIPALPL